ncbi:hypothetical protein ACM66B_001635 [Microbotryomycetes sp. NB124-2]
MAAHTPIFAGLTAFFSAPCPPSAKGLFCHLGGLSATLERVERGEPITLYFSTSSVEDPLLPRLRALGATVLDTSFIDACIYHGRVVEQEAFVIPARAPDGSPDAPTSSSTPLSAGFSGCSAFEQGHELTSMPGDASATPQHSPGEVKSSQSSSDAATEVARWLLQHSDHARQASSNDSTVDHHAHGGEAVHELMPKLTRDSVDLSPVGRSSAQPEQVQWEGAVKSSNAISMPGDMPLPAFKNFQTADNAPGGTSGDAQNADIDDEFEDELFAESSRLLDWHAELNSRRAQGNTPYDSILLPSPVAKPGGQTESRATVEDLMKLVPTLLPEIVYDEQAARRHSVRRGLSKIKLTKAGVRFAM